MPWVTQPRLIQATRRNMLKRLAESCELDGGCGSPKASLDEWIDRQVEEFAANNHPNFIT